MRITNQPSASHTLFTFLSILSLMMPGASLADEVLTVNSNCVVSILNRTVVPDDEGNYLLENIPSSMGQIKARATCQSNGQTIVGETDYFTIPTNDTAELDYFYVRELSNAPRSLRVRGGNQVNLSRVGQTFRLSVLAEFPDGRTDNVTSASNGINYLSSNTRVATVTRDGVITAVAPGRSLISIRKDGVVTAATVNVVTSGDTDGDGIPDEVELANGLDPNDPVDAFEDLDGDGISSLDEYRQYGTDMNNPDTDGDGIPDGEEIRPGTDGFVSSPLLRDTDGDGVEDQDEIALNTDPSDPNSVDFGALITGIDLTPDFAAIFYNTIDTESSVQFSVMGDLVGDGSVDLTNTSRGTNYQSSDLSVANFGSVDGEVFAAQDGVVDISVENSGFSDASTVVVRTFEPQVNAFIDLPSEIVALSLDEDFVFAVGDELYIVDVTNFRSPVLAATVAVDGTPVDIQVSDNSAFVITEEGQLIVFDITDARSPVVTLSIAIGGAMALDYEGSALYVGTSTGITMVDVSDSDNPSVSRSFDLQMAVVDIAVEAGNLALINDTGEVVYFTIGTDDQLLEQSRISVPQADKLELRDGYAYLAADVLGHPVVDFSIPTNPSLIDEEGFDFISNDVVVIGNHAFYADRFFASAVPFVNISIDGNPQYQGVIDMSRFGDTDCFHIDADDTHVVCGGGRRLLTSQYRQESDTAGVAPTISWLTPAIGSTLGDARPYYMSVEASDDINVAQVNFYVDGEVAHYDIEPPYSFVYNVEEGETQVVLEARAIDFGNNASSTGSLIFDVTAGNLVDEDWNNATIDIFEQDIEVRNVTMASSSFISDYRLSVVGDLTVSGGNSLIQAQELAVTGDLIIDGVTLSLSTVEAIRVLGDIRIINGGALTIPHYTIYSDIIRRSSLRLDVEGRLFVDAESRIELLGKGLPGSFGGPDVTRNGNGSCYGGVRSNATENCTYGRYEQVVLPGSGASGGVRTSQAGKGGGFSSINASVIENDGTITVNGAPRGNSNPGGAGGGIHLETSLLEGGGRFLAMGSGSGTSSRFNSSGGGRISVYVDDMVGFSGSFSAATLERNTGRSPGGSGTVFIRNGEDQYGELTIDNNEYLSPPNGTPIASVGRHLIEAIEQVEDGLWSVRVAGMPWHVSNDALQIGLSNLNVILDATNVAGQQYTILRNTEDTIYVNSDVDLSEFVGNELVGIHTFDRLHVRNGAWVDFGDDYVRVLDASGLEVDSSSHVSAGLVTNLVSELPFTSSGNFYLSEVIEVAAINLTETSVASISAPRLDVRDDIVIADSSALALYTEELTVNGDVIIDSATLSTQVLSNASVQGSMSIVNGGVLTLPDHDEADRLIERSSLNLSVSGTLIVDANSSIDFVGKGLPALTAAVDGHVVACHGGLSGRHNVSSDVPCAYGRYGQASLPGSGPVSAPVVRGNGGGFLSISADRIEHQGLIDVSGGLGGLTNNGPTGIPQGGAGGGLHIEANVLTGVGDINARGAALYWHAQSAGGGRVSVVVQDMSSYEGAISAATYSAPNREAGGAGTIYLREGDEQYGELIIDNGGYLSSERGTPIASVGRHTIQSITEVEAGLWNVQVSGTPWRASGQGLELGVSGLSVLLDADDTSGAVFLITSNTENTLIIESSTDISAFEGRELIGIHTFDRLTVANGGWADFGEDFVRVLDDQAILADASSQLSSGIISDSFIEAILAAEGQFNTPGDLVIEVLRSQLDGNTTLSASRILVDNDAYIAGETGAILSLLTDSDDVSTEELVFGGNLTVDGITLLIGSRDTIRIIGNLNLVNGARITTRETDASGYYPLNLDVQGIVNVDATSTIDVSAKGYGENRSGPDNSMETRTGCHAGNGYQNDSLDCAYGRYDDVRFAGSSGTDRSYGYRPGYSALGGGYLSLIADSLILEGSIEANGAPGAPDGAGGGVSINVNTLSGTGLVDASGIAWATTSFSAGGGRIAITGDTTGFLGELRASGGAVESTDPRSVSGGAGTVFVRDAGDTYGQLLISNADRPEVVNRGLTVVEHVGRHTIQAVTDLGTGEWEIDALPETGLRVSESGTLDERAGAHYFTLAADQTITFSTDASFGHDVYLFRDDGSLSTDDLVSRLDSEVLDGRYRLDQNVDLQAGDYVAVVRWTISCTSCAARLENTGSTSYHGPYSLSMMTERAWAPSDESSQMGIQGLTVDLDLDDGFSPLYTVMSNDEWRLIVETADDLSGIVGNEIVGVHQLDALTISDGARVDFGGDRVDVSDPSRLRVELGSRLENVTLDDEMFEYLMLQNLGGEIVPVTQPTYGELDIQASGFIFEGSIRADALRVGPDVRLEFDDLQVAEMLSVDQGSTLLSDVVLAGELRLNGATLEVETIEVTQNFSAINGATVTTKDPVTGRYYPLHIQVGGELVVDALSHIDVDGKGYLARYAGPNHAYETRQVCHGGVFSNPSVDPRACIYGRYAEARFAGSGGQPHRGGTGNGGGFVNINAGSISLDGSISANGGYGNPNGAGGGVRMVSESLSGNGQITADTAWVSSSTYKSGGGRVSIHADVSNFTGTYSAFGEYRSGNPGGAGTVYVQSPLSELGGLAIDNNGAGGAAQLGLTLIESIGRHRITDIMSLDGNRWQLDVLPEAGARVEASGTLAESAEAFAFSLTQAQPVMFDISADFYHRVRVFRDDGTLDSEDSLFHVNSNGYGVLRETRQLEAGDYVAVLTGGSTTAVEAAALMNHTNEIYRGDYALMIASANHWTPTNEALQRGIQGLTVDLDAADSNSPLFEVIENDGWRLVVESTEDLSNVIGNDLIGVHQFETLAITGAARVDFGGDRIEVSDLSRLEVSGGALLEGVTLDDAHYNFLLPQITDGSVVPVEP